MCCLDVCLLFLPASFRTLRYSISEGLHHVNATLLLVFRSGTVLMLGVCLAQTMPNLMMHATYCIMEMQAGCLKMNSVEAKLMANCILCLGSGQTK